MDNTHAYMHIHWTLIRQYITTYDIPQNIGYMLNCTKKNQYIKDLLYPVLYSFK